MTPISILRFRNAEGNIVKYTFDPSVREEEGLGPVSLECRIRRHASSTSAPNSFATTTVDIQPPAQGTQFYRYIAKDGAEVRYQYDAGSRNGKDYVVAIHRDPENWQMLRGEDLAVADESLLERIDSMIDEDEDEVEVVDGDAWADAARNNEEKYRRRDSIIDDADGQGVRDTWMQDPISNTGEAFDSNERIQPNNWTAGSS